MKIRPHQPLLCPTPALELYRNPPPEDRPWSEVFYLLARQKPDPYTRPGLCHQLRRLSDEGYITRTQRQSMQRFLMYSIGRGYVTDWLCQRDRGIMLSRGDLWAYRAAWAAWLGDQLHAMETR